jgi:hypothetical protein
LSTDGARRNFPLLLKLATDLKDINWSNPIGDRLYESMQDFALSDGPITFPMTGCPCYLRNKKSMF